MTKKSQDRVNDAISEAVEAISDLVGDKMREAFRRHGPAGISIEAIMQGDEAVISARIEDEAGDEIMESSRDFLTAMMGECDDVSEFRADYPAMCVAICKACQRVIEQLGGAEG